MIRKKLAMIMIGFILSISIVTAAPSPQTSSEGAILIEVSTGRILYEKNGFKPLYPASTTKVLTGVILAETFKDEVIITKTKESKDLVPSDSSHVGLEVGDQYSYEDGLYAILMSSDNFVAYDMAMYHSGSIQNFAEEMNQVAKQLGVIATHFVNPHGYHDAEHYMTPYDLGVIATYAFSNPLVEKIAGTPEYEIDVLNAERIIKLKHTAQFFHPDSSNYNPNVVAAKTGYHTPAGRTLVAKAEYGDLALVAVSMRADSPAHFEDVNRLLEYGAENFVINRLEDGSHKIENKTYSQWAKPYIEEAIEKSIYIPTFESYMDKIAQDEFVSLLKRRLEYHGMNTNYTIDKIKTQAPFTIEEAQAILTSIARNKNKDLSPNFVRDTLAKIKINESNRLTLEESIFIQGQFIEELQ